MQLSKFAGSSNTELLGGKRMLEAGGYDLLSYIDVFSYSFLMDYISYLDLV